MQLVLIFKNHDYLYYFKKCFKKPALGAGARGGEELVPPRGRPRGRGPRPLLPHQGTWNENRILKSNTQGGTALTASSDDILKQNISRLIMQLLG